jgi:hypothetical protein
MKTRTDVSQKLNRRRPWWKTNEEIVYLFETLLKPFEETIIHDTRQRDIVGTLRQLDVGVIDNVNDHRPVKSFVEVQKRRKKVTIDDLGNWDYKRRTLGASEMTIISETGFSASVIDHVKDLHADTITLGLLYPTETGLIERFNATFLGIVHTLDLWSFASIIVQYADDSEIDVVPLPTLSSNEEKIFGSASPMDLVRWSEAQSDHVPSSGSMRTLNFKVPPRARYRDREIKRVIIVAEKLRRIWEPRTLFFAFSGVYPVKGQRGIAAISTFRVDEERSGTLTVVFLPDPENMSGGAVKSVKVAGQFEFF